MFFDLCTGSGAIVSSLKYFVLECGGYPHGYFRERHLRVAARKETPLGNLGFSNITMIESDLFEAFRTA